MPPASARRGPGRRRARRNDAHPAFQGCAPSFRSACGTQWNSRVQTCKGTFWKGTPGRSPAAARKGCPTRRLVSPPKRILFVGPGLPGVVRDGDVPSETMRTRLFRGARRASARRAERSGTAEFKRARAHFGPQPNAGQKPGGSPEGLPHKTSCKPPKANTFCGAGLPPSVVRDGDAPGQTTRTRLFRGARRASARFAERSGTAEFKRARAHFGPQPNAGQKPGGSREGLPHRAASRNPERTKSSRAARPLAGSPV